MPFALSTSPLALPEPFDGVLTAMIALDTISEPLDALAATLDPAEQARAASLRAELHRARFIRRRWWRTQFIARTFNLAPADIRITHDALGCPTITAPHHLKHIHLSTASAGNIAALALAPHRRLGIDLAHIDPAHATLDAARIFMHPDELAAHAALPPTAQPQHFFQLWTRKEALLKTLGTGFATDPRTIDTRPDTVMLPNPNTVIPPSPDAVALPSPNALKSPAPIHLTNLALDPADPAHTAALAMHAPRTTDPQAQGSQSLGSPTTLSGW